MQAIKGKRSKPGAAAFKANLEKELLRLERRLNCLGRVHSMHPTKPAGYVLRANGVRRLPEENVRRFRNRLRGLRDRWRCGVPSRQYAFHRRSRCAQGRNGCARRHPRAAMMSAAPLCHFACEGMAEGFTPEDVC